MGQQRLGLVDFSLVPTSVKAMSLFRLIYWHTALVCPKCSIAEIVDAGGLCVDCSLALMCGKCGQIEKATDKKYCAACAVEVLCKKCGVVDRLKGMLYCKGCEKIALGEMAALGYLVPTSPNSTGTRKNVPHRGMISEGNWENGVRAGEDRNE